MPRGTGGFTFNVAERSMSIKDFVLLSCFIRHSRPRQFHWLSLRQHLCSGSICVQRLMDAVYIQYIAAYIKTTSVVIEYTYLNGRHLQSMRTVHLNRKNIIEKPALLSLPVSISTLWQPLSEPSILLILPIFSLRMATDVCYLNISASQISLVIYLVIHSFIYFTYRSLIWLCL